MPLAVKTQSKNHGNTLEYEHVKKLSSSVAALSMRSLFQYFSKDLFDVFLFLPIWEENGPPTCSPEMVPRILGRVCTKWRPKWRNGRPKWCAKIMDQFALNCARHLCADESKTNTVVEEYKLHAARVGCYISLLVN